MSNFGVTYLLKVNKGGNRLSIEDNIGEEIHVHFGPMRLMFSNKEFKELSDLSLDYISDVSAISVDVLEKLEPIFLFDLCRRGELTSLKLFDQEYVSLKDLMCPVKNALGIWKHKSIKHSHFLKVLQGKTKKTPYDDNQINYVASNNLMRCQKVLAECRDNKDICEKYPLFVTAENIIRDGQHRAAALYYLYGPDFKVRVQRMETNGGASRLRVPLSKRFYLFLKDIVGKTIAMIRKQRAKVRVPKKEQRMYFGALRKNLNLDAFVSLKNNKDLADAAFFVGPDHSLSDYPTIIRRSNVSCSSIKNMLRRNGYKTIRGHINEGFSFIYGLKPDLLIIDKEGRAVAYLQDKISSYAMSVDSFMPYAPEIQRYLSSFETVPDTIMYVLRLLKCMFDKHKPGFQDKDIEYFESKRSVLEDPFFDEKGLVEKVFFGFTPLMISLLRDGRYGDIIKAYRSFEY